MLSLNKNSLKQQRDQLAMYRRYLPSLDLKRRQLLGAWKSSVRELEQLESDVEAHAKSWERWLPLFGSTTLRQRDLSRLVTVRAVEIDEERIVGTRVPVLSRIEFERSEYSTLALPFWIDLLVDDLERAARFRLELQVKRERTQRLAAASRKITQRVNLFEKVLIPGAISNIHRIEVALSDEDRAAVVRSKLAKRKKRH
jgi:V/A-type H+-transporting ATPase subunit D